MPIGRFNFPIRGMDDRDALTIPDDFAVEIDNIRLHRGNLQVRPGVREFDALDSSTFTKPASTRNLKQVTFSAIVDDSDLSEFLMFGDNNLFKIDNTSGLTRAQWTELLLSDIANDSDSPVSGERFSVINTLDNVFWSSWNTRIRVWDGLTTTIAPLVNDLGGGGGNIKFYALSLVAFANRIIAIGTREVTNQFPARIRWCANGQITKWDPALTDGAGLLDIVEQSNSALTGGFVLNGRCYLTKETELIELIATGNVVQVFRAETREQGVGMPYPHSWAAADYFGFFVGQDDVYRWDGSTLTAIGQGIRETLFEDLGDDENATVGSTQTVMGMVFPERHEYWLYPGTVTNPTRMWIYNYRQNQWYHDKMSFLDTLTGMEVYRPRKFLDGGLLTKTRIIVNANGANRLQYVEGQKFDNTAPLAAPASDVAIPSVFESKENPALAYASGSAESPLGPGSQRAPVPTTLSLNTVQQVRFRATKGEEYEVGLSVDKGDSYHTQVVRAGKDGIVKAFFNRTFLTLKIRVRHLRKEAFTIRGPIEYIWKPAGMNVE